MRNILLKNCLLLLVIFLFNITCRSAGEKTLAGEGAVDDLELRGYTKFTIFKGRNLLGYAQDPDDPKDGFRHKVWEVKEGAYKSSKVEQRLVLEFSQEKMAEAKVTLAKVVDFDVGKSGFQKVRLILENPIEYVWEDVVPIPTAKPKLLERKYIYKLLQVSRINLEFETQDGKRLKTGADLKQHGVQLGVNARTSESEKAVFFAKNAYVGFKLAEPPKELPKAKVVSKFKRVLIAPFVIKSKEEQEDLERLLYDTTRSALNRVEGIKTLERDPGVLYAESQLKDRTNIDKLRDVASLQGADLIFVGEFHRYGGDVVAKIQGFLRDKNGELVPGKDVRFTVSDMNNVQFLALGDMWEKELLTSFNSWTPKQKKHSTKNEDAYKYYLKGLEEVAKRDKKSLQKAISLFEKAIELDPNYTKSYALLSEAYTEIAYLKYGSIKSPSDNEIQKKHELQEQALKTGERALYLQANSSLANRALARYYFTQSKVLDNPDYQKDREKALKYAQKALELDKKDAKAAWLLFFIKVEADKRTLYDKNNPDYQKAYRLNPTLFESFQNMGTIFEKQEEYDKAIENYKSALAKSPKHLKTHFDLARVYRKKHNFGESLHLLKEAEKLNPKNYLTYEQFVYHYRDKKKYEKADEYYQEILEEDIQHFSEVVWGMVDFYANEYKKPEKAIEKLQDAIQKNPKDEAVYSNALGYAYYYKGDYDKAIEYYQKSLELYKKENDFNLILVRNKMPSANKTERALVLKFFKDWFIYGYDGKGSFRELKLESNEELTKELNKITKELTSKLNKTNEIHPGVAENYNNIGVVYQTKKEYDKAKDYFEKALLLYIKKYGRWHPFVAECYNNMGVVYRKKGNYKKSILYNKKSLKIRLRRYGPNDLRVANSYNNLGSVYLYDAKYDKAMESFIRCLRIRMKKLGPDHPSVVKSYKYFEASIADQEHKKKAIKLLQESAKADPKHKKWFVDKEQRISHEVN